MIKFGTANFLKEIEMDDDALRQAITGTIDDVDSYKLPNAKGYSRYIFVSLIYIVHKSFSVTLTGIV